MPHYVVSYERRFSHSWFKHRFVKLEAQVSAAIMGNIISPQPCQPFLFIKSRKTAEYDLLKIYSQNACNRETLFRLVFDECSYALAFKHLAQIFQQNLVLSLALCATLRFFQKPNNYSAGISELTYEGRRFHTNQ